MNINYENVKAAYYRGKNLLKIYSGSTLEWEYETEPIEQTTKQIWYNSVSGDVVEPYAASAMGTVVSNTAYETKCVLEFASDVTAIGANAFSGCTDLEYVSLPVSAISIGDNAFDGCSSLDDIYMPSVQSIGRESFKDCAFTAFTVPTSVTAITADAFKGVAIEEFNYNGTKAQWSGITYGDFWDDETWLTRVVHCSDGDIELYQIDYSKRYLELVATSGGTFQFSGSSTANTISYSTDQGKTWSTPAQVVSVNVNSGDSVMWKGELRPNYNDGIGRFSGGTATFDVQGNILSLYYSDNFKTPTYQYQLSNFGTKLFASSKLVNAENLVLLPLHFTDIIVRNWVGYQSYMNMFSDCTLLTTAPQLPETIMKEGCYKGMFSGCTSLTTAPSLPATSLWESCYSNMFKGCTSLVNAPSLPAPSVPRGAYFGMFENCTSLVQAPALPATTLETQYNYAYMFKGCRSLTQAPSVLPATSVTFSAYTQMFSGCTSLTTAPSLPATTLGSGCYADMFNGCSRLTTAPSVLPATTLANDCYRSMFSGCTSLTTAPSLPATTLADACYLRMFSKCTSLTAAPQLPSTGLTSNCYANMFQGCTALTAATQLPATTLANQCYLNMYNGCTSLTTAPDLSATTLVSGCYGGMFYGCTNLNYIKMLATDISASACLNSWVGNVANSGTFVKAASMTTLPTGVNGIPNGWTVQDDAPTPEHDYSQDYFTIVAKDDGTIVCGGGQYYNSNEDVMGWCEIEYSTDNGETWAVAPYEEDDGPSYIEFEVHSGDTIMLKYDARDLYDNSNIEFYTSGPFSFQNAGTAQFEVQGNIMSLIYGDDFTGNTSMTYSGTEITFLYIFSYNAMLVSAENLILPATTLTQSCYQEMFNGCDALTKAPALPATTLVESCYSYMFQGCTSLNYIKMLATDISANDCLNGWVSGVAASGTFVKAANATIPSGNNGIPNGWTVQDDGASPEHDYSQDYLTFVATSGGTFQFSGSSTANTISYSTDSGDTWSTPSTSVTVNVNSGDTVMWKGNMTANNNGIGYFSGGTATFDAQGNVMSLLFGDNYINQISLSGNDYALKNLMKGTKVVNAKYLVLPATTLVRNCYDNMFSGCTSLTTAPLILPATTLTYGCYSAMFQDCTSLIKAPELPALQLTSYCYNVMFQRCSSLNYIKAMFTTSPNNSLTENWVQGVAATGTFVKNSAATWSATGSSGIPNGWTVENA